MQRAKDALGTIQPFGFHAVDNDATALHQRFGAAEELAQEAMAKLRCLVFPPQHFGGDGLSKHVGGGGCGAHQHALSRTWNIILLHHQLFHCAPMLHLSGIGDRRSDHVLKVGWQRCRSKHSVREQVPKHAVAVALKPGRASGVRQGEPHERFNYIFECEVTFLAKLAGQQLPQLLRVLEFRFFAHVELLETI